MAFPLALHDRRCGIEKILRTFRHPNSSSGPPLDTARDCRAIPRSSVTG
jgi:hypothetical protein